GRQHPRFDTLTGDGCQLERPAGSARQPRHAPADDFFHRIRRADATDVATHHPAAVLARHHPVVDEVTPQLTEEERIAAAALRCSGCEDAQLPVELLVERTRDVLLDARGVEPSEPDAGDSLA